MYRAGSFGRILHSIRYGRSAQELVKGAQRLYGRHRRALLYSSGGGTATVALSLFGSGKKDLTQTEGKDKDFGLLQSIREADTFYNMYMIDNAYGVLRKYRKSEDPEVLWRLARLVCEQGKMCKNADEKKRLFYEALDFAEKAVQNEGTSGSFAAHKWYAIILNYVGEQEGTKAQIKRSYDVKVHLERALELNPIDATTWHILGVWHFTFADLPSYQRLVAKAIFGTPPSSSYEEALRHFERAETLQPGFYTANQYYLGQVYERIGQKEKAIEQYQKAFQAPTLTVDDNDIRTKVFERLKKLGVKVEGTVPKPLS